MIKDSQEFKSQLRRYKLENNLLKDVAISEEERKEFEQLSAAGKPLPDGIFKRAPAYTLDKNLFFKVDRPELKEEVETVECLLFAQSKQIKTIHRLLAFIIFLLTIVLFCVVCLLICLN
jgi:hypothetical protein